MLTGNLKEYYKVIGMLQMVIANATVMEDVLRECISIIKNEYHLDDAVVWYKEVDDSNTLNPNYWICPMDLTSVSYKVGEGIVGRVFESENACRILDINDATVEEREELERVFSNIKIKSMICVPLSNKETSFGCLQFIVEEGGVAFSEEDADLFEIIALMMAIQIDKNPVILAPIKNKKCILSTNSIIKEFTNGDRVIRVLKGVSLDIYEGEFLVLLGESGSGKSTLLNVISGLDKPTSGTFNFMGTDLSNATQEELSLFRRDNIGFIFQSYNLMPNLTAKQNLDIIAELVDDPMDSKEALDMVGLNNKYDNYPSQLSGGQQQRVSIARAIVKKPKLILADEPTAALDYATAIEVLSVLENIVANGDTLVMVTHNEEITRMANRVIRLRNGKPYEVTINRHPAHAEDLVW